MNNKANLNNIGVRIAAYIRVSTEEQKLHGLSVDAQKSALEDWAKKSDLKIVKFYNDAGFSARKPYHKRPAMVQLLEDVQANKIDLIIFTKLDRWFRSLPDYFKVQEILEKNHVDWKTIHEDYDTSTSSGRLKINIMLSVAQDEADRTSERIKAVFEMKREKREPLGGNCPTGYRLDEKRLVKDPETETAVNAFFQKFLACGSVSVAQREALENGLRIEYQLASKMLDSPAYYGLYYNIDGMTPPYITKEEFDRIQALRVRPIRKTKYNRTYLFSGIAICGECGYHLGPKTNTRSKVPMYNCPAHYIKRSGCGNKTNLSERKIEAYLIDHIEPEMSRLKTEYEKVASKKGQKDHKQEIAQLKGKLSRLKDLYLNDLITLEEYKADQAAMMERVNALIESDKPRRAPDFARIEKMLPLGWKDMYQDISKEDKREFWQSVLKEVRVYPDRHIEFEPNL